MPLGNKCFIVVKCDFPCGCSLEKDCCCCLSGGQHNCASYNHQHHPIKQQMILADSNEYCYYIEFQVILKGRELLKNFKRSIDEVSFKSYTD